ncbi:MAG: DUF3810 domain-containing protein [Acidobacteriota bacterium]
MTNRLPADERPDASERRGRWRCDGRVKGRLLSLTLSMFLLLLMWLLSRSAWWVESVYAGLVFPLAARILARLSSPFPFSLAETLAALFAAWLLWATTRAVVTILRHGRRSAEVLIRATLGLAAGVGPVLVLGYLLWGLNYARADLVQRLNWQKYERHQDAAEDLEELSRLCSQVITRTNLSYVKANGSRDQGYPSKVNLTGGQIDAAIDEGFRVARGKLGLSPSLDVSLGPAKPVFSSVLLSYLGIAGFYFPWTGEANYNRLLPDSERCHVIAHEKAHQRALASEEEAGFMGFLACVLSPDLYVRYSGYFFAQGQLVSQLARLDPSKARQLLGERLPGVERDVKAVRDYWRRFQGAGTKLGATVNDSYLKLHGVEGGIDSYSRTSRLLILLARSGGEDLDGALAK